MLTRIIAMLFALAMAIMPLYTYSAPLKKPAKSSNSINSEQRAKQTVAQADKPLEPTNPKKATHGHGHSEHGYQTTAEQQENRVSTGQKPSGVVAKAPTTTSKFSTPQLEAEALGRGQKALETKLKSGTIPKFKTNGEPNRINITVSTDNPQGFGSSWKRKLDSKGNPIKDSKGNYISEKSNEVLKNAQIIYEYVPSKNTWNPVTYYPVK